MVVLGGRSDPDEFSSDVLLYQVNCNAWLLPDLTRKSSAFAGRLEDILEGSLPCPGNLISQGHLGPFRPTSKAAFPSVI